MNRLLRLLIAVLCLLGPWLGAARAGVLPLGQNAPTEERETSQHEEHEVILGSTKRHSLQRGAAPPPPPTPLKTIEVPRVRLDARPEIAHAKEVPHRPAPKVLFRRSLPVGDDPLS